MASPTVYGRDPITGEEVKNVYARDGNLVFGSYQTQVQYYKLLENGYVVVMENGVPRLERSQAQAVWDPPTYLLTSSSPITETVTLSRHGTYELLAEAPELTDRALKKHIVTIKIQVVARDQRRMVQPQLELALTTGQKDCKIEFTVVENDLPAIATINLFSNSYLSSIRVKATLKRLGGDSHLEEDMQALKIKTNKIRKPGEYMVELQKDAKGFGMTFRWDNQRNGQAVKGIEENGTAARSTLIRYGDVLRAVQGERVDDLGKDEVINKLRNTPLRIVLLLEHPPKDWPGFPRPEVAPKPGGAEPSASRPRPPVPGGPRPVRPPRDDLPSSLTAQASNSAMVAGNKRPPPRPPREDLPSAPLTAQKSERMTAKRPLSSSNLGTNDLAKPLPAPAVARRPMPSPELPPKPTLSPSKRPAAPAPPPPRRTSEPAVAAVTEPPRPRQPAPRPPPKPVPAPKPAPPAPPSVAPALVAPQANTALEASPPETSTNSEAEMTHPNTWGAQYEKYVRMKRAGLPDGAVVNAMNRDSVEIPSDFFGAGFVPPTKSTITIQPKHHDNDSAVSAGGGGLVDALKGFDQAKLRKHVSNAEMRDEAPPQGNDLMAQIAAKAKGGLKKRTTEENQREDEEKRRIADKGKDMFNTALLDKFKNANPHDDDDDDDSGDFAF